MTLRALSVLSLLAAAPSLAQTTVPAFSLERLSPDPANLNSILISSGDGLRRGTARFSLMLHYERDPLVYYRNGERTGAVISSRFTAHLGGAYALTDWLELGLQLPLVLRQGGDDLSAHGLAPVSASVIGSPLVQGRFTVLRESNGNPFDLGVTLGLAIPLGSEAGLYKDPGSGLTFVPRLGLGRTLGDWFRLGAEVGAVVRGQATLTPFAETIGDQVGSMVSLGASLTTRGQGLRGELNVRGLLPLSRTGSSVEVLGGVRYAFLGGRLEAFALGGPGFGRMPGTPAYRLLGGLSWTPVAPSSCVEGQAYPLSQCPALDRDGDSVKNAADVCPEEAGSAQLAGCPMKDDDRDHVANDADACPDLAGPATSRGCPADTDGDGLPDAQDKCPQARGVPEHGGCPADSDGDGLPDAQDKCPAQAGPSGSDGCAPQAAVTIDSGKLSIAEKVNFASNKAELLEKSYALLKQVAQLLKAHPELTRVRIEGHTDNSGSRSHNIALSQKRAEAVKQFLIDEGVEASRLDARGFGPDRPLAPNTNSAGKELNRRVEFITEN